jgi:hypothetical protein
MKSAAPAGLARRRYIAVMTGRGLRGRRIARQMIVLAVLPGLVMLFAWITQPGYIGPMFRVVPWFVPYIPFIGFLMYVLGLGWMVRIYRADPEPDRPSWRYRDF